MKNKYDFEIILEGAPNEKYQKFFEKFKEINTTEISSWKGVHLLGYFCKKYQEQYQVNYKFKFNTPIPSKCFEVFQIKKLALQLTADPILLKEYIDWIFLKAVQGKRKFTSISFITNEKILQEYKFTVLLINKQSPQVISRSTPLPEEYKSLFFNTKYPIETYGDLAFVYQACDILSPELIEVFLQLEHLGFDKNILNTIV